tara:strand:+ start:2152 stop:4311 length:2160 start_codon:yes stop_codon:yes gene_type:complete
MEGVCIPKGSRKTWTQMKKEKKENDINKQISELIEEWDRFREMMKKRNKKVPKPLTCGFINKCREFNIRIKTLKKIINAKTDGLWPENLFEYPYEFVLNEPSLITYPQAKRIQCEMGLEVSIDKKIDAFINYIYNQKSHLSTYDLNREIEEEHFSEEIKKLIFKKLKKTKKRFKNKIWSKKYGKMYVSNYGEGDYFYTCEKVIKREKNIENIIRELSNKKTNYGLSYSQIKSIVNRHINGKDKLAKEQKKVLKLFFGLSEKKGGIGPNICGLTGGPGAGKSYTLTKIIDIEKEINPESKILGTALAGMAVNALKKSTNDKIPCKTLHKSIIYGTAQLNSRKNKSWDIAKQLKCSWQSVFYYYQQKREWPTSKNDIKSIPYCSYVDDDEIEKELKLYYDLVFIDETTMINIFLLKDILTKLIKGNPDIRIIFVGDINQLPSIGPGQFFKDLLQRGKIKGVELIKIHRQKNLKLKETIKSFLDKNLPIPENHEGFKFIKYNDNTYWSTLMKIINEYRKEKIKEDKKYKNDEKWGNYFINEFQILSPQKNGISGVKDINNKIQVYLKTLGIIDSFICEYQGQEYHIGDKIINTRNDYEHDPIAYNGQIGVINGEREDGSIVVKFDDSEEVYIYEDCKDLKYNSKPAYCVTIHKSQGSGFKNVVLFINEHSTMWPTNGKPLLYTGASRTKENLWIIGNKGIIKRAKNSPNNIFTTLFRQEKWY